MWPVKGKSQFTVSLDNLKRQKDKRAYRQKDIKVKKRVPFCDVGAVSHSCNAVCA